MDLKSCRKRECPKCSKPFKTNYALTRHIVKHDPDAQVKCEVCGIISKNWITLNAHIWNIHSNRKRPSCETCHAVFPSSAKLRRHIDAVHSTKERPRFPCTFPGCEKTYLTKNDVAQHVKIQHAQNPVRFWCTLCGKKFKTRGQLEQHIATHTTEKPYNCATCGKGFPLKANMKSHEMTHLDKSIRARSKCDLCPQTFVNKGGLQLHVRVVHENRRNYPCTFCDQRFSYSSHLKRHVVAKHVTNKELAHSCDKCEFKTHSKANLALHRMRHNGRRHGCYFCAKKFVTFTELDRHTCRVHTLEKLNYYKQM